MRIPNTGRAAREGLLGSIAEDWIARPVRCRLPASTYCPGEGPTEEQEPEDQEQRAPNNGSEQAEERTPSGKEWAPLPAAHSSGAAPPQENGDDEDDSAQHLAHEGLERHVPRRRNGARLDGLVLPKGRIHRHLQA